MQHRAALAAPPGPQTASPQRVAGSPARRLREASLSPHQAVLAEWSELGFRRPTAWWASALPRARAASARRWVQPRAAWRRRAALPFAHRAVASEWLARRAQRVALRRMEPPAIACAPAEPQLVARDVPAEQQQVAAYARAEPQLAASVRAALLPEAALDARASQPGAALLAVLERRPAALAAPAQQEAVVSVVRVQQPAAVPVAPERRLVAREDGRAERRQGAEADQAVSAQPLAAPPSVAASVFPPARLPPSSPLVPRRAARFAHAMRSL
ncbi:hypothetical protein [Bradyrhizobium sp. BRP22]|uniref:hypothetical protein n=1 Tax=Bradyrhizobium sp. BRP22 TaxID=2793821 RepID=UPI0031FBBE3D